MGDWDFQVQTTEEGHQMALYQYEQSQKKPNWGDCAGSRGWGKTLSDLEASTEGEEWGASIEDEEEGLELRGG